MTTTMTRRIPVHPTNQPNDTRGRLRGILGALGTVLTSFRADTGRVLAVHCPTCRHWVKPTKYAVAAGTCRRCSRNRDHAAYHAARNRIHHRTG